MVVPFAAGCGASGPAAPVAKPAGQTPGNEDLRAALGRGPQRVLVTVRNGPIGTPLQAGVGAGPYAAGKSAVVASWGSGITIVRDYNNLPTMLVQLQDGAALDRLAALPGVTQVSPEGHNSPN